MMRLDRIAKFSIKNNHLQFIEQVNHSWISFNGIFYSKETVNNSYRLNIYFV